MLVWTAKTYLWKPFSKNRLSTITKRLLASSSQQIFKLAFCYSRYFRFLACPIYLGQLRNWKPQCYHTHAHQRLRLVFHCQDYLYRKSGKTENELLDSVAKFLTAEWSQVLEQYGQLCW
jgi:hypothetical protein